MKTALVLFAEGSEELEAVTIVNILRRAGVTVTLAGLNAGQLRGSRGVVIQPDTELDTVLHHDFDMLVLPGGQPGTRHMKNDTRILKLVRLMTQQGKFIAAICAAPSILAEAGLLAGKRATSYPGSLDEYASIHKQSDAIVEDGKIITSRGPGTAMDFALTLVELLVGTDKRQEVESALVR